MFRAGIGGLDRVVMDVRETYSTLPRPPMSTVYKNTANADEFALAFEQFHQLVTTLRSHEQQQMEHGELESWLHGEGMELLRRLPQGHLDLRARREVRLACVSGADGVERRQARPDSQRGLMTRFGEVQVRRLGYRAKGRGIWAKGTDLFIAEIDLPPLT